MDGYELRPELVVRASFSRTLERQRDEALEALRKLELSVNALDFTFHRSQPDGAIEALIKALRQSSSILSKYAK